MKCSKSRCSSIITIPASLTLLHCTSHMCSVVTPFLITTLLCLFSGHPCLFSSSIFYPYLRRKPHRLTKRFSLQRLHRLTKDSALPFFSDSHSTYNYLVCFSLCPLLWSDIFCLSVVKISLSKSRTALCTEPQ